VTKDAVAGWGGLAAVILAGGSSSRMGVPKALLRAPGGEETFLDRLIGILRPHCSPVIVVLGHEADRIRAGLSRQPEAVFAVNHDWARGQLSSLQTGLGSVPAAASGVLFTPVDYPMVRPETIASLAEEFARRAGSSVLVIPRFQGKSGHPVCLGREIVPAFLNLPEGAQARDVIHRHTARTCYVDVDDPGVLFDIDDPEAYRAALGSAESQ
jgi:molybdenum cofactor cytidylyltransferase